MLRDVFLHGAPGREFGRRWHLDVASPAEAVRALMTLRPKLQAIFKAGLWRVIVGPPRIRYSIGPELVHMQAGAQAIHLVPAHRPHSGDDTLMNVGKIIVGVALVALAIWNPMGWTVGGTALTIMASAGVGLAMGGVAGMLTPHINTPASYATDIANSEDRPSFLFNGATNNSQQGGPVPVVMGTHLVGSTLVSGSINTEDIPV